MRPTIVYIDGFNLYYRALRGTPYKWLDLEKFCDQLLPKNNVTAIRYFTAAVKPLPNQPGVRQRQSVYWRALRTLQRVDIIEGNFKIRPGWRRLHKQPRAFRPAPKSAWVKLPEEKGSDVNLASTLLLDASKGACEVAVVISNDSDLCTPVEMTRTELGTTVGIVNPDRNAPMQLSGDFVKSIRRWHLDQSQFPADITDDQGTFHKPPEW